MSEPSGVGPATEPGAIHETEIEERLNRGGLLIVDKPGGVTSHDVVQTIRRRCRPARVGHGGTLDPLATGVLPILIGPATRLLRFLPSDPKVYRTRIRLGLRTDTGDIDGRPLAPLSVVAVDDRDIARALARYRGVIRQIPPMFSAKKIAGQRLHRLARRGETVAREPVPVRIDRFDLVARTGDELELEIECAPGTYIRSLATDLGDDLGPGATVVTLRRTRSGACHVDRSIPLSTLVDRVAVAEHLLPLDELSLGLAEVTVERDEEVRFRNGQRLLLLRLRRSQSKSVESSSHNFLARARKLWRKTPNADQVSTAFVAVRREGRLVGIAEAHLKNGDIELQPTVVMRDT